jgi:hypothetical protein
MICMPVLEVDSPARGADGGFAGALVTAAAAMMMVETTAPTPRTIAWRVAGRIKFGSLAGICGSRISDYGGTEACTQASGDG